MRTDQEPGGLWVPLAGAALRQAGTMQLPRAFKERGSPVASCVHALPNLGGLREKLFIDFKSLAGV